MKYELFLSDFDGTLVRADGTISQKNVEAVAKYRENGGIFAVVTGRMLRSIRARLKELGLCEGLVVAYQGAVIADIATGKLLRYEGFDCARALKVLHFLEREGHHIQLYMDDTLYCNRDDELLKIYEKICGVKGVPVKEPLSEMVARERQVIPKILVMLDPREKGALMERLRSELGEEFTVTSSSDWLVEVLPAGVSKADAVRALAEHYRIPSEKVAAIGDQLNDLPMLEAAGGKFAVANAEEALKKIATVVPSVEEDGVAVALGQAMQ